MVFLFLIIGSQGRPNVLFEKQYYRDGSQGTSSFVKSLVQRVHSEVTLFRLVNRVSAEDDLSRFLSHDTFPSLHQGYFRTGPNEECPNKMAVWSSYCSLTFVLLCEPWENIQLASSVLAIMTQCLQDRLRIFIQCDEIRDKSDVVLQVIDKYLPQGILLFMNHKLVKQYEKEIVT